MNTHYTFGIRFMMIYFCLLLPTCLLAQNETRVSGVVIDQSTNEVVVGASVSLLKTNEQRTDQSMQTSNTGQLQFLDVQPGVYTLRITYIGYQDYVRENLRVESGKTINLGNIFLLPAGELLDEVVVRATVPDMEIGIDRRVFNVAQSTISVGGSASDLLANVPSLQVDMDGSVSLRGSSSVRILIDGKESAMAGGDITQLLQSMPANSIERIEVITNPSAKFDAEGQSGIINIVLKKNVRTGLNGSVNASAGSYNNYTAGTNLNYRDRRFNLFGSYNFNRRNNVGDGVNNTRLLGNNAVTNSNSESERLGLNHSVQLGYDRYIGEKTTLGAVGNLSIRGNNRDEDIFFRYQGHPLLNGTSDRLSRQNEDDLGYDFSLDFKQGFRRLGEELTANFTYGRDGEEGINTFDQTYSDPTVNMDRRINNSTEAGSNINVQLDYVLPFNEQTKFESGYRTIIRRSNDTQHSTYFDQEANAMLPDYAISNDFDLESMVHALYANYQQKITEKLGFQVGVRAEQAYLNTRYQSFNPALPENERSVPGNQDYFRLYPSVFLTQELGDRHQLQASYTRRVSRPRGWQVNPFIDVSDELNRRQGNPDLMPEDIHSFELGYSKFWQAVTLTSSLYHRRTNDVIQPIIVEVDQSSGGTFSQWQNISRSQATGLELISKINFNRNVDITANVNAFQTAFQGSEEFNIASNNGFSWNANATTNVKITPNLSGQARFEYQAPRVMAQGKGIETYVVDAGLRWDVMNKKGSVMFNARDLLNQRRWGGFTETNDVYRYFEHRWMRRTFTLSFSYRFGQQDFQDKDNRRRNSQMEDFGGGEGGF